MSKDNKITGVLLQDLHSPCDMFGIGSVRFQSRENLGWAEQLELGFGLGLDEELSCDGEHLVALKNAI